MFTSTRARCKERPLCVTDDLCRYDRWAVQITSFDALPRVLQTYLPALVDGVFGHLFHGLLYLGWSTLLYV